MEGAGGEADKTEGKRAKETKTSTKEARETQNKLCHPIYRCDNGSSRRERDKVTALSQSVPCVLICLGPMFRTFLIDRNAQLPDFDRWLPR